MTNSEISELISIFDKSTALTMKLSFGDFSIELDRKGSCAAPAAPASVMTDIKTPDKENNAGSYIKAPLVGTFYSAASPDDAPFVKVGDRVKKGQTVCLIEAMKMMSEVAAPCDCVIDEIKVGNGDLLSYDAPIFRYREA